MARTLVWMTHSFRPDSRLTCNLRGECAFVYYSPYHFAGERERKIYQDCSQANLDAFYFSINAFDDMLAGAIDGKLHIYRESDPIKHINKLIKDHGFVSVVIDRPLFAMWHGINLTDINAGVKIIDSDTVDHNCLKMTAKSRWTSHIKTMPTYTKHVFSPTITNFNIPDYDGRRYPDAPMHPLMNRAKVLERIAKVAPTYKQTRDRHDGQTNMSVALHNGIIDPGNVFYDVVQQFIKAGVTNINDNDGPAAAILRQMAFREIAIIQARHANMTLENTPLEWAKALMHYAAFDNMVNARPDPRSNLSVDNIDCYDKDLSFLAGKLISTGVMPNRARMYFASHVFYCSPTGTDALETIINTFDRLGLDGQSPNNYTQAIGALGLSYGKVLKMNRDRAFELLGY